MAAILCLDDYERRARLAPGLLVLLPVPVAVAALGFQTNPVLAIFGGLLLAVGAPLVLASYVRGRGKTLEDRLNQIWGGPPTSLLLTPGSEADPVRDRRRANVARVAGIDLPTAAATASDENALKAATISLRQKTYNHDAFPMVFNENKSYGFMRNTRAVRTEGISVSGLFALATIALLVVQLTGDLGLDVEALIAAVVVNLILLVWWIAYPSDKRVKQAGFLYAEQLLDAAETLS